MSKARVRAAYGRESGLNGYISRIAASDLSHEDRLAAGEKRAAVAREKNDRRLADLDAAGTNFNYGVSVGGSPSLIGSFEMTPLEAKGKNEKYLRVFINSADKEYRLRKLVIIR